MNTFTVFVLGCIYGVIACSIFNNLRKNRKDYKLTMKIELDATQAVAITAKAVDKENNPVDLADTDLVIEAEGTNDKNFGEVNDANDTFDPGEAGATGIIRGTVTLDGKPFLAEVEVELVPGAPSEMTLEFAPVAEAEPTPEGGEGDPEDGSGEGEQPVE